MNMAHSLPVIEKIGDLVEIDATTFPQVFYESLESIFRYSLVDIKEALDKTWQQYIISNQQTCCWYVPWSGTEKTNKTECKAQDGEWYM